MTHIVEANFRIKRRQLWYLEEYKRSTNIVFSAARPAAVRCVTIPYSAKFSLFYAPKRTIMPFRTGHLLRIQIETFVPRTHYRNAIVMQATVAVLNLRGAGIDKVDGSSI